MKRIFVFCFLLFTICSANDCNKKSGSRVLKGKLVIKELCGHYVIQVTEGSIDSSKFVNGWKDEKRNQVYDRVFTVANRCDFPANEWKEGDAFEFEIDASPKAQTCMVCMAFYPTPAKTNAVKIIRPK